MHPTIAVTPERLCLGLIDTYHWSREELHHWENHKEKNRENHKIPLNEKESYKWLLGYRKAQEIAHLASNTKIVTVTDREGDLYDLYHEAYTSQQSASAYWLIRAMANRRLLDENDNLENLKLIETVKNTIPIGTISAGNLQFTMTGLSHGQFISSNNSTQSILQFAQSSITAGKIQFIHDGSNILPQFNIAVSDGNITTNAVPAEIRFQAEQSINTIAENKNDNSTRNALIGTFASAGLLTSLIIAYISSSALKNHHLNAVSKRKDEEEMTLEDLSHDGKNKGNGFEYRLMQ